MMEPGPFQQSFYPDGEHQYLLPDDDGALPAYATTRRTWIMFCVTFGVLHGCAVTSMVYASSLQGKDLSSASLGAFFSAYTTAALFVATDVVRRVGVLYALLTGFCGYVLLAASYLSYEILGGGAVADTAVMLASVGAGVGGATLWVGQTQHYAQASAAHADVCVEINQCVGCVAMTPPL